MPATNPAEPNGGYELPNTTDMNSAELLRIMGTDPAKWTEMFLKATNLANAGPDFVGTVLGWFANAIGAGEMAVQHHTISYMQFWANQTAHEKGWYDGDRPAVEGCLLRIIGEVSEAEEEYRRGYEPHERYYEGPRPRTEYTIEVEKILLAWRTRIGESMVYKDAHLHLKSEEIDVLVREGVLEPKGIPSELADVLIRIFDFCADRGIELEDVIQEKMLYNKSRTYRHGGKRT